MLAWRVLRYRRRKSSRRALLYKRKESSSQSCKRRACQSPQRTNGAIAADAQLKDKQFVRALVSGTGGDTTSANGMASAERPIQVRISPPIARAQRRAVSRGEYIEGRHNYRNGDGSEDGPVDYELCHRCKDEGQHGL